jgi:hypothetical protein
VSAEMRITFDPASQYLDLAKFQKLEEKDAEDEALKAAQQLQREYVVSSPLFQGDSLRTVNAHRLSQEHPIDEQTYERMLGDPDVASAFWLLVHSVLADQLEIRSAVADEKQPDFKLASDIFEFCQFNMTRIGSESKMAEILPDMMNALVTGNRIAELVYEYGDYNGSTKLFLRSIKVKPRRMVAFVVDKYYNVHGFVGQTDSMNATGGNMAVREEDILPREKFWVFAVRVKDSDPRGNSYFRPAYNGWNFKTQVWPEYLLWLLNCAVPGLLGFTGPNAPKVPQVDANGQTVVDAQNNVVMLTPEEAMVSQLSKLRNAFCAAFPNGSNVVPLDNSSGDGEPFKNAVEVCGAEITKGILSQTLATREGEHDARAAAEVHAGIVNLIVWWLKGAIANSFRDDVLKNLVRYNFGDDAAMRLTPVVALGDTERKDWAQDANAAGTLVPYLTVSEWNALKMQLGIPQGDPEDNEMIGTARAKLQAALAPKVPGDPKSEKTKEDPEEDPEREEDTE